MSRRGWLAFVVVCLVWGIPYLLIKVAVRHVEPATLVWARTLLGFLLLFPVALWRGALGPALRRHWPAILAYTLVELAVPWWLLSEAERRLPSSLSGLLVAGVPIVGALIGRFTGQPRLGAARLLGLGAGVVGVGVLLGVDFQGARLTSLLAMAVVVVGYAAGPAIAARHLSDAPALGVITGSLGLCAAAYTPWVLTHLPATWPGVKPVAAIVVLGVVCTAVAFVVFFDLLAEVGPSRSLAVTYVNPAVAVVLGVAFLHESFGVTAAVGFVLILAGSYLSAAGGLNGRWWPPPLGRLVRSRARPEPLSAGGRSSMSGGRRSVSGGRGSMSGGRRRSPALSPQELTIEGQSTAGDREPDGGLRTPG